MTDHVVWNELGLLHYSAGAFPQAIQAYQRALDQNGEFLPAWLNLARAYTRNGDLHEAEKTYFDCLEIEKQTSQQAEIWTLLGQHYAHTGNPEASQDAYHRADTLRAPSQVGIDSDEADVDPVDPSKSPADVEPDSVKLESARPEYPAFAQIKLENIYINPRQPRMRIDVQNLVESVREHGVIQPIIVSPNGEAGHYILVSGQRRFEAARQVGLESIPAVIREVDEQECLELALTENLQRQNLSSLEQADAYAQLRDEFELTPEEIARRMGKSSVAIQNLLQQLVLPERIKRALDAGRIQDGHARAILKLDDPAKQLNAYEQVLLRDLSVRKTEALVRLLSVELEHEYGISQTEEAGPEDVDTLADLITPEPDSHALRSETCGQEVVREETIEEEENALEETAIDEESTATEEAVFDKAGQDALIAELFPDIETVNPDEVGDVTETDVELQTENATELFNDEEIDTDDLFPDINSEEEDVDLEQRASFPTNEDVRLRILSGENVVAQNPNNEEAWRNLAENYSFLGEVQKAIDAYREALFLAPQNASYYDKLGHLYIASEQYVEAVDSFEKALALDDENIYVHCALASSYRRIGMLDKAQIHIDLVAPQMIKESPYNRACFEAICRNVVQAIELLNIALDTDEATVQKIENDHDFDFIRQDELFIEFLQENIISG